MRFTLHLAAAVFSLCCMSSAAAAVAQVEQNNGIYLCQATGELHVFWHGANSTAKAMVCLYNQDIRQTIVLTGARQPDEGISDPRLHLVFKIPPRHLTCKYTYMWKIEPLLTQSGASGSSQTCSSSTPNGRCEIEVGSSSLCPQSSFTRTKSLACEVLPPSLTPLHSRCQTSGAGALQAMMASGLQPDTATAVAAAGAALAALALAAISALAILWALRRRRRSRQRRRNEGRRDGAVRVHLQMDSAQAERLLGRHTAIADSTGTCVGYIFLQRQPDSPDPCRQTDGAGGGADLQSGEAGAPTANGASDDAACDGATEHESFIQ